MPGDDDENGDSMVTTTPERMSAGTLSIDLRA